MKVEQALNSLECAFDCVVSNLVLCEHCNLEADSFEADPYSYDVHGDDTPVWLCDNCRHERAMDV